MTTTKKYRCLIVDDEPIARKIIKNYVGQMPNLECVGECKNAFEAIEQINGDDTIEILFLDINMPNISGISMMKILNRKPFVIFTTAYSEFAVESYELDAVDYLLKPFLFDRFAKAVFKAIEKLKGFAPTSTVTEKPAEETTIFIKSDGENYPVFINDILYCEAMKNYLRIFTTHGKTYTPLISISKFQEELSQLSPSFLRIHRSFIVSKKYLHAVGANYVMIEKNRIPIGEQYKEAFLLELGMK